MSLGPLRFDGTINLGNVLTAGVEVMVSATNFFPSAPTARPFAMFIGA